jgi:hypothetical protein
MLLLETYVVILLQNKKILNTKEMFERLMSRHAYTGKFRLPALMASGGENGCFEISLLGLNLNIDH